MNSPEVTNTVRMYDQPLSQTRRLGEEGNSNYFWEIRNDRLKKIIIDVI